LNLRISWYGSALLFGLFLSQLVFENIRLGVSAVYVVLALVVLFRERGEVVEIFRHGIGGAKK
jgi:hypothetical protein